MQTNKYLAKVAFVAGDLAGAKRMVTDFLRRAERAQDAPDQYEAQRSLANIAAREGDWPGVTRALERRAPNSRRFPPQLSRVAPTR